MAVKVEKVNKETPLPKLPFFISKEGFSTYMFGSDVQDKLVSMNVDTGHLCVEPIQDLKKLVDHYRVSGWSIYEDATLRLGKE